MSSAPRSSSPLDVAERAVNLLVQSPTHVGFDGNAPSTVCPDRILLLDELRASLLSRTGVEVRDGVWRELVVRTRRDGPPGSWLRSGWPCPASAARKLRDANAEVLIHVEASGPTAAITAGDVPDLVLARAVAAGVIDADEANLIGAPRLGHSTLAAAARLGVAPARAGSWRRKAGHRLVQAIRGGESAFVALRPHGRRGA